jgi:muramidase (phage lysozyme)
MGANLHAFLLMIQRSEGTTQALNPYACTFGYKFTITDFSDHPYVLGNWLGEPLDFLGFAYEGKISTAAGAYQLIAPTWRALKKMLGLPDFSIASQDAAATELIREAGALDLVKSGNIAESIGLCRHIWASLPGSTAGQPTQSLANLISAYMDAGGAFA